ncbi:NACHT domain-containing protein [Streptomyces sp. YS-3]|uniref:NACHT domain-containing protein n=1 Tax=Streptomyces sp. YS-3 TaxID=3381352 RepID=UPI00386283A9
MTEGPQPVASGPPNGRESIRKYRDSGAGAVDNTRVSWGQDKRHKRSIIILGCGATVVLGAYYALRTLEESDQTASVVGSFLTIVALTLALVQYHEQKFQSASPPGSLEISDGLAVGVEKQWRSEWQVRELENPYLLPVAWRNVEGDLVEGWDELVSIARGWPGGPPGEPSQWPVDATGLCGSDGEIDAVFLQFVPTRRLVILGDPGSGKSVLLTRLQGALLRQRADGGRVPIVFSLASWNVNRQTFRAWLTEQLVQDHEAALLSASTSAASRKAMKARAKSHAAKLIEENNIWPLLDGLDELPRELRPQALSAINAVLPSEWPLVLSSRTEEYREALRNDDADHPTATPLRAAGGIQLLPLSRQTALEYLRRDAGVHGSAARARWDGFNSLPADAPVAEVLKTPLGVFLAKMVFNPRAGEPLDAVSHPRRMLDHSNREDLLKLLFASFLPAAYRINPELPCRWSSKRAERTLRFLADHLEQTPDDDHLRWWQLHRIFPRRLIQSLASVLAGLAVCGGVFLGALLLTGMGFALHFFVTELAEHGVQELGRLAWATLRYSARAPAIFAVPTFMAWSLLAGGLTAISAWVITENQQDSLPATGVHWSWQYFRVQDSGHVFLAMAAGASVTSGAMAGFPSDPVAGLRDFTATALIFVPILIATGLAARPLTPDQAAGPLALATQDLKTLRTMALRTGLGAGLTIGLVVSISAGASDGYTLALVYGVCSALAFGLPVGLTTGLAASKWAPYAAVTLLLALRGHVPWHLQAFLADAHRHRGVLRQAGTAYQFRHRELQRHLARGSGRAASGSGGPSPS